MEKEIKTPKCQNPDCRSNFGYYRLTTGEWVCRTCGNVYKMEVKQK